MTALVIGEEERLQYRQGKRSELEMRIDVLKVIYKGATNPERIRAASGLNYSTTKKILVSFAKKHFIEQKYLGNGRSRANQNPLDKDFIRRRYSRLAIVITQDGNRALTDARRIQRQLLDEEIDWR